MGDRNFDPEATREVAQNAVPTIATAYAELSEKVVDAGENMENGGVSEEMNAYFTDYHLLLRNATTETSENLERLAETLLAIADDDELAEGEISQQFETAADEVQSTYTDQGYTPMSEETDSTAMTPAPSEFDSELGSSAGTRSEGQRIEED